ncbi:MAG: flagellar hook-basal body complex protein FliE [Bryobacterales bacterium]|nr:flagellar hook-basal body complex protein FliE [Bryobacterales bacterium]
MDPIRPITAPTPLESLSLDAVRKKEDLTFGAILEKAVDHVATLENESKQKIDRFLRGEDQELHDMMLSTQRAGMAFDMFMQVRNKVVQAYQEVMRMQI